MDTIALLEACENPTALNIRRAINVLTFEKTQAAKLCIGPGEKREILSFMSNRINFAEIIGHQESAAISLRFKNKKLSENILKQIAGQWKPVKNKLNVGKLLVACRDPTKENLLNNIQSLNKQDKKICKIFYAVLSEIFQDKYLTDPDLEEKMLLTHFEIFQTSGEVCKLLNVLCNFMKFESNSIRHIINEVPLVDVYFISLMTNASDIFLCVLIDRVFQLKNITKKHTDFLKDIEHIKNRPAVLNHIEEAFTVAKIMQS